MNCPRCATSNEPTAVRCAGCGNTLVPRLAPGGVLAGRYEIEAAIGKGGMGMVFRARDRLLSETVAIKVLRPDLEVTPELERRFIDELKLARTVSHRYVCRIHEYGVDEGLRYISMAYVEGQDLKHLVQERGALPVAEAYRLSIAIAEGLQAIHDEGIVHRDLKPQNVMVDAKGVPRLMDFGIARHAEPAAGRTDTGHVVGTPDYMSPEQIRGQRLDVRSDVYALGVLVHELFTGHTPFESATTADVLVKHLKETPRFEASRLPTGLAPILARALQKDRDKRFASAGDMARALAEAQASRSTTAPAAVQETGVLDAMPATLKPGQAPITKVAPTVPHAPPPSRLPLAAGAVAAAVLVGIVGWQLTRRPAEVVAPPPATVAAVPTTVPPTVPPTTLRGPEAQAADAVEVVRPTPPPAVAPPTTQAPVRPVPAPATPDPRIAVLMQDAERALRSRKYDEAIGLYDNVLALDPGHADARKWRNAALEAQVTSSAVAPPVTQPPVSAGRSLIATGSVAKGPDQGVDKAYADGFEAPPGMDVTRDTNAASLPGQLNFEVTPAQMKSGAKYQIRVLLKNTGAAPIGIRSLIVTTERDGKKTSGPAVPLTREVAPRQTSLLVELKDTWPDAVATFTLQAVVRTDRGETYRNELVAR